MKSVPVYVAAIVLAGMMVASTWGQSESGKEPSAAKAYQEWEYKVAQLPILNREARVDARGQESILNDLGEGGWQLVETRIHTASGGISYHAILKRPK